MPQAAEVLAHTCCLPRAGIVLFYCNIAMSQSWDCPVLLQHCYVNMVTPAIVFGPSEVDPQKLTLKSACNSLWTHRSEVNLQLTTDRIPCKSRAHPRATNIVKECKSSLHPH